MRRLRRQHSGLSFEQIAILIGCFWLGLALLVALIIG